jgi:hypothetical protein
VITPNSVTVEDFHYLIGKRTVLIGALKGKIKVGDTLTHHNDDPCHSDQLWAKVTIVNSTSALRRVGVTLESINNTLIKPEIGQTWHVWVRPPKYTQTNAYTCSVCGVSLSCNSLNPHTQYHYEKGDLKGLE